MTAERITTAVNRFGLGARAGEWQATGTDPRGWLLAQLGPPADIPAFQGLPDSTGYLGMYLAAQQQRKQMRARKEEGEGARAGGREALRRAFQRELVLRQSVAVTTSQGFRERLVRFWSNHFAISVDKRIASLFAAPMEREAIRPHVTGRFSALLQSVEQHAGMLLYLDNAQSIGEGSRMAMQSARRNADNPAARKRGLNENLAREILELHTLGVDSGYTQHDVAEVARAITGWSVARHGNGERAAGSGGFLFRASAHEPGLRQVLGKPYRQQGEQQGVAILQDLAVHPATAQHLSMKLARHFVADVPPPALVARMAKVWLRTDGDLAQVCAAMVEDNLAWQAGARKFKTPDDFLMSALRGCGLQEPQDLAQALQLQTQLGQPVFQPRSPAGFGDVAADWGGPDALYKRVQAAQAIAGRLRTAQQHTPLALGQAMLGNGLDAQTATALRRAESVQQGVALLLGSPAFQWRV